MTACLDDNLSMLSLQLIGMPHGAKKNKYFITALKGTRCSSSQELSLGLFIRINAYALF